MEQKSTKILVLFIAVILIVGCIMIFVKGLNFELKYQEHQKIDINLGKEFDENEIRAITNEVFENQSVIIQAIEVYKDAVSIRTTQITDEQKTNLIAKINEKYEKELLAEDVIVEEIAHTRGRDIIKPYVIPFAIVTGLILLYFMIRYNKLNCFKVLIQAICIIVLAQLVLLGIMAITRMPIGLFTIPTVLIVYVLSMYICTSKFEEDLGKKQNKENGDNT